MSIDPLNLNSISPMSSSELGLASDLLQVASQLATSEMATSSLHQALSQMGLSNAQQQPILQGFQSNLDSAMGLGNGNSNYANSQLQQVGQNILNSAYDSGGLANSQQQLAQQLMNLITQGLQQAQQSAGSNGSSGSSGSGGTSGAGGTGGASGGAAGSWLEAIAQAMGQALGQMAAKLVQESQNLQNEAGSASGSSGQQQAAEQFQADMSQFQADSQMFSMLSNAFATAIKSIGEGMQTMASKQ